MRSEDPITLEVVRGSLVSTVLQMRATMIRTAYAPILYETLDFSCGLLTRRGELAAMSEDFSGHVFAMALGLTTVLEKWANKILPGDVLAINDPYTGGTHLNDVAFYSPVFFDGELLLFIGVRAHFADVGGATPGSFSGQDTEIYQEGVRIVPVKLIEQSKLNQGLWDVLFANMRLRDDREGDSRAMLETARVAEMRISELCRKYGPKTVENCINIVLDSAEKTMRERISQLPSGEYHYEHYMDNSGITPEPLPIKVTMTIKDGDMTFDFTGTSPQVEGPMNCGIPVTQSGAFVIVKSWLDPQTPVSGGSFRPLKFIIPKGSCLAAELPAAVGGCWDVHRQLQTAVVGVLSQAMPHLLAGENIGAAPHVQIGGYDRTTGERFILYETPQGGTPATSNTDGATGCEPYDCGDLAGVSHAESIEQYYPILVESMSVLENGESAGYRRSGFGVARRLRILCDSAQLNVMADRAIIPPWGSAGAYPGSLNYYTVIRGGEVIQPSLLPGKVKAFPLHYNDVVVVHATAGGGVGDSLGREVELVGQDVLEGYISEERARDMYGVVIENGEVNLAKSRAMRRELKKRRYLLKIRESETDDFDGRGCRLCLLSDQDAEAIGVKEGGMVECVSPIGPPLRAWVKVVPNIKAGHTSMGPIGRKILHVVQGDEIWFRSFTAQMLGQTPFVPQRSIP